MFSGNTLIGSDEFLLEKATDGEILSRMVLLDPGQAFDNITITPGSPGSLLAVGAMVLAEEAIALGDFNMDGEVNDIDGELFSLAYSGADGFLPFWAADGDADNDGDIDATDYETFAQLFPCLIGVDMMPSLSQDAVATGERKRFEVVARPLGEAGPVSYEWTATAGTFDDPTNSRPEWKAPASIEANRVEVAIQVRIQSAGCNPRIVTITSPSSRARQRQAEAMPHGQHCMVWKARMPCRLRMLMATDFPT